MVFGWCLVFGEAMVVFVLVGRVCGVVFLGCVGASVLQCWVVCLVVCWVVLLSLGVP